MQSFKRDNVFIPVGIKGHCPPAHMRITYHFIANLHITETRPILLLTKYDENNIMGGAKAHSKTVFQ